LSAIVVCSQSSIAFAKSTALVVSLTSALSHAAAPLSIVPSQSSSKLLPGASNAPGLTSFGALHSVESQQSPPHVVMPSPSAS
jgi:hypothetical protein